MKESVQITNEIKELKEQLSSFKGTETEVYTRIVGYYRSVRNWNKGKREEYNHRLLFDNPEDETEMDKNLKLEFSPVKKEKKGTKNAVADIANYQYYYRDTCPNCPPVKNYIADLTIGGTELNVDSDTGRENAVKNNVLATPTVIFFDNNGMEILRANGLEKLKEVSIPETTLASQL